MTLRERDTLVVLLAVTAGSVDAWSYVVLGHVFIANMTGNTVLLGVAFSHRDWSEIQRPLFALTFYGLGVFAGGLLARRVDPEQAWSPRITRILALESLLLLAAAVLWGLHSPATPPLRHLLVAGAAFALGLQSASMQALKLPGIVTTYITGTWTTLWSGLARFVSGTQRTRQEGRQLTLQAAVLAAYCSAAALAGLLAHAHQRSVGTLPAAAVLAVVLLAGSASR
jgi:uncharacterized membrane protein YoaK (UPF0700 family)